jgi:RND family efflux transporter MFP subunit
MSMLNREGRGRAGRALGVLALVVMAGCGRGAPEAEDTGSTVVKLGPTDVTTVQRASIESGPVISGTLQARNEAQVRAQAAGTITAVYAEQGQAVKEGQLLARIEAAAPEQALVSAQQAVRSAQQSYEVAQRQAERQASLLEAGAVAEQAVETARSQASAAQAQLANARAQLTAAQKQVANTEVRSPINGVVSARPINAGDVVTVGGELFTVVNPGAMKLEASVPSEALAQVHINAPVTFTVTGYPGRTFSGRVERINPAADPTTRQVPIFVTVPNEGGTLVSGLFAQGRVASTSVDALVVPSSAVDQTGAFPVVLQVTGGQVKETAVKLGVTDAQNNRVALASGVSAGDTVLTNTAQGVPAGTPVQVTGVVAQQ